MPSMARPPDRWSSEREVLDDAHRVVPRQHGDHRPRRDALGLAGQPRQELGHVGRQLVVGEVVLGRPDRVEAGRPRRRGRRPSSCWSTSASVRRPSRFWNVRPSPTCTGRRRRRPRSARHTTPPTSTPARTPGSSGTRCPASASRRRRARGAGGAGCGTGRPCRRGGPGASRCCTAPCSSGPAASGGSRASSAGGRASAPSHRARRSSAGGWRTSTACSTSRSRSRRPAARRRRSTRRAARPARRGSAAPPGCGRGCRGPGRGSSCRRSRRRCRGAACGARSPSGSGTRRRAPGSGSSGPISSRWWAKWARRYPRKAWYEG